ncbi:hypothetical protein [Polynucleobacter sp. UK-Mo-2m-Kol15]|uniref:hypothetical protein n=1 Tax=Polynucleobacter sp. UK-Mo-2m-Kol15 TaxID=2576916 RepID=UPI001C0D9737|nr:hypothetical protein [Polynucleobacter sp. UK-Mo-2m-Kol15]MBU3574784.1 hypothetical protein [Polynucleobacter sp. UK-Mo-2m-Kol15]
MDKKRYLEQIAYVRDCLNFYEYKINFIFCLSALFIFGLAVIGVIKGYSNIPFWDMWDGYLDFYTRAKSGNWYSWVAQHNEHRILLSRILFWIDLALFHGQVWFLLLMNFVFITTGYLIFRAALKESPSNSKWVSFFIFAWLFSWCQKENLTWGFQSQFFLAQLLPLASFYLMHKSSTIEGRSLFYFLGAAGCGLLSAGAMANGVITLPLLSIFCVLIGGGWRRIITLCFLSACVLSIYFFDYIAPVGHSSLSAALSENPKGFAEFVLMYLGGPFYYVFGMGKVGFLAAKIAGGVLIFGSIGFALKALQAPKNSTLMLALLFFILYVGGSAFGTAGGRLNFGVEASLASRYTTPALMCWAAFIVLIYPFVRVLAIKISMFFILSAILVGMMPAQLKALNSQNEFIFEKQVASLAIELGVRDQQQVKTIFPNLDWVFSLAKAPIEENVSIFGSKPLKDLRKGLGQKIELSNLAFPDCNGHLDDINVLGEDPLFDRVRGWVFEPKNTAYQEVLYFIDDSQKIVGYAYSGQERPDVGLAMGRGAERAGFKGYLFADMRGKAIYIVGGKFQCRMAYASRFTVSEFEWRGGEGREIASVQSIDIGLNSWIGKDFYKSNIPGFRVLGSFINSDMDTGSVVVKLNRGDKLLYRSGPTNRHQMVEIINSGLAPTQLPLAKDWVILEFSDSRLPDNFLLKLTDQGVGWGEWSAIGLKVSTGK